MRTYFRPLITEVTPFCTATQKVAVGWARSCPFVSFRPRARPSPLPPAMPCSGRVRSVIFSRLDAAALSSPRFLASQALFSVRPLVPLCPLDMRESEAPALSSFAPLHYVTRTCTHAMRSDARARIPSRLFPLPFRSLPSLPSPLPPPPFSLCASGRLSTRFQGARVSGAPFPGGGGAAP